MIRLIVLLVVLATVSGCNQKINNIENISSFMKVSFKTIDDVTIVGNFYDAKSDKNVILLHRLNMDKSSWTKFPQELQKNGFNVLSIDFRGHGESDYDWNDFGDKEFNDMTKDVESAVLFINNKHEGDIFIVGESIGANTALNYALERNVNKIVLLSPGLEYRGIKTNATKLKTPMLLIVGEEDDYSYDSAKTLYNQAESQKELKVYANAFHGTRLFEDPEVIPFIVNWILK